MAVPRSSPYIWVTWLSKLLAGENSCEWAAWFKAQHRGPSFKKMPNTFDQAAWVVGHTSLLNDVRTRLEQRGETVYVEGQNRFILQGASGITLGGKPDLVSITGETGVIYDVKTGQPQASHQVQVMIYMYAYPKAFSRYKGVRFNGKVVYSDYEFPISADAINESFLDNLVALIRRTGAQEPSRRVPSPTECGYCEITSEDCPDRIDDEDIPGKDQAVADF